MIPLQPVSLTQDKPRLRALVLARRAAMGERARMAASRAAGQAALDVILSGPVRCVALFAAIRDEIDPRPLAELLRAHGVELALPVVCGRDAPLIFRRWAQNDPLTPAGRPPIPTPDAGAPEVVPDVVLVPLAAFDAAGFRIGYGGGFYDRTLALLRAGDGQKPPVRALGFAFACQQVDRVPREAHDEPVDMMVTEGGVFSCRSAREG